MGLTLKRYGEPLKVLWGMKWQHQSGALKHESRMSQCEGHFVK